jgi:hypothetical protein
MSEMDEFALLELVEGAGDALAAAVRGTVAPAPESLLAARILAVHEPMRQRAERIGGEPAHVPVDHLGAAWDGLLRPHTAKDLARWTKYVERAERLVKEES